MGTRSKSIEHFTILNHEVQAAGGFSRLAAVPQGLRYRTFGLSADDDFRHNLAAYTSQGQPKGEP
jgi:hypothetical protein